MSGVQSLERAFAILRALAVGPAGVTDLADRVDLPKSTVSRLLSALEEEGVVAQLETGGEYRLGQGLVDLAGASAPGNNLVAAARPFLIDLTDLTNETSGVSVLDGDEVYYLEHVETDDQIQVKSWTGESLPLHCVASGLVLLAHSDDDFVDEYLSNPLESFTPKTITTPAVIRQRLENIRRDGFVWVRQELDPELCSVAAVALGPSGTPEAALHVHGPSYRFPPDESDTDKFGRLVLDAAGKLSTQLAD